MKTRVGQLEVSYGARGASTYRVELWHDGLKKHRVIKGSEREVVRRKAEMQVAGLDEKWSQSSAREKERRDKEGNRRLAIERTAEAQRKLDRVGAVLHHTLEVNDEIEWEDLKNKSAFPERQPAKPQLPVKPKAQSRPPEPRADEPTYQPKLGLLDKLVASRRERIASDCRTRFQADHRRWQQEIQAVDVTNAAAEAKCEASVQDAERQHEAEIKAWEDRRAAFVEQQQLSNEAIDKQRAAYMADSPDAITEYCDLVLSFSDYPDYFPQEYSLEYNPETKVLVVDYALPAPEDVPTVKEVKYVPSREEFTEQHLSQAKRRSSTTTYCIKLYCGPFTNSSRRT
jgi:restriction system protein